MPSSLCSQTLEGDFTTQTSLPEKFIIEEQKSLLWDRTLIKVNKYRELANYFWRGDARINSDIPFITIKTDIGVYLCVHEKQVSGINVQMLDISECGNHKKLGNMMMNENHRKTSVSFI